MEHILTIQNLKYKNILNEISLDLEKNSFNILAGESGTGKTTLIKSILGLIKYEGQIYFENSCINEKNINEIGVCFSSSNLLSSTVLNNLLFPLVNLGYSEKKAKKRAYEISKKLDISSILNKNIDDLSTYELSVVSFACCVIHDPKLLLIDNSFDMLDNYYRNKIINYMKKMESTIVFVTNNEKDFLLADKILFLKDGKIDSINSNELINSEKKFIKYGVEMPFLMNLSLKLMSYEVLDDVILNVDEMVDEIWK